MSKKHTPKPRPAHNAAPFPAACNVLTPQQRDLPNLAAALAELGQPQPSERARLRAATAQHEQRETRSRREAHQILTAAEAPAPSVWEDLQAVRRRPLDAPMATRIGALPDPQAVLAWDAIVEDAAETASKRREKWLLSLALAAWSAAWFVLGTLA